MVRGISMFLSTRIFCTYDKVRVGLEAHEGWARVLIICTIGLLVRMQSKRLEGQS
jgi:hypothetical protein